LAQKIHENPTWAQNENIMLKLDRIYFSSGDLYGVLLKAILKDGMESRGSQMEILDLVLRLDQVLNPLY
jgi:hypothetical protein